MIVLLGPKFDYKVPRTGDKRFYQCNAEFLPGNNETIVIQVRNKLF